MKGLNLKKKQQKSRKKGRRQYSVTGRNSSPEPASLLARAIHHYQDGDLPRAEQLCEKILSLNPRHGEALHLRAVISCMNGRPVEAVALFQRAIQAVPDQALYHYNLGNAYKDLKRFDEAIACYQRALELKPDYREVLNNLGIAFHEQGRYEEAAASYQRAIRADPEHAGCANVYCNLANALRKLELGKEAVLCYREALKLKPDFPEVYRYLGDMFAEQGKLDEAGRCYERALELRENDEAGWFGLADLYKKREQFGRAMACYQKVIDMHPDRPVAYNNLGNVLRERDRLAEAEACYRRALELDPEYTSAHSNLGNLLKDQGLCARAEVHYRRALEINAEDASIHSNLGNALRQMRRLTEAEACHRRALEIDPSFVGGYSNLGSVLMDQGRIDEAIDCFRQALEFDHTFIQAYYGLFFALLYHPDKSAGEIFADFKLFDQYCGLPLRRYWRPHENSRESNRRLKVGYVSATFYRHVTRHYLEPLLANHDRRVVEVFAYVNQTYHDEVTERYRGYVDHWVPVRGLSDAELAERIRAAGIDILVDISGHTMGNRLPVFARKPAPVSLHWLDFGYTTGLTAIDYYLGSTAIPAGEEKLFAETLWQVDIPDFVYRPAAEMGPVNGLPARDRGYVTFGILTRAIRINQRILLAWVEILKRVKGSRLIIDSGDFGDEAMREKMAVRFVEHGIERERLQIGYHSPPWDVLRATDIALDCFPTNSSTTILESLYMGLPAVTLAGGVPMGYAGKQTLMGLGRPEWIARTEAEYVEIAVNLAADIPALAALRAGLRGEMEASPLMDEPGFARKMETAYREMFTKWCEKNQ